MGMRGRARIERRQSRNVCWRSPLFSLSLQLGSKNSEKRLTRKLSCPDEYDKTKFDDLHRSIRACDDVLTSVETNLTSFRNDLAAVSADIETLQARSTALNVRLENRRAVEKGLGPIVEELSVSPTVVSKIAEGQIDEAWIKCLAEVDRRAEAHKKSAKSGQAQSRAQADMGPLLEKLTAKVRRVWTTRCLIMCTTLFANMTFYTRRLSREYEITWWHRSRRCARLT